MDDEAEVYLEDDRSGAEFRLVMEEGGRQCTLVYGRGPAEISESVGANHQKSVPRHPEVLVADSPKAFKFFTPFEGLYDIDHMPMCFTDVQDKIDGRVSQCFDACAQNVRQVLDDARSFIQDLHETPLTTAEELDLMIGALPHALTQVGKQSSLQRLVELRVALDRTLKSDLPL
jgi:hypothetical protein